MHKCFGGQAGAAFFAEWLVVVTPTAMLRQQLALLDDAPQIDPLGVGILTSRFAYVFQVLNSYTKAVD